ncbi:MAG TPA: SusD/RagB family nutrient-binding outer membrane lipoprotein [Ohtaekwangia sp.]
MKAIKHYKYSLLICSVLFFSGGCDQDFVEVNTNPYAVVEIDPALLFAGAQRSHVGTWAAEHTIVQQFVIPSNQGATLGFSLNADIDGNSNPKWDQSYGGAVRSLVQALELIGDDPTRNNLRSMVRIWKAQVFMGLVDAYGNVPYTDAGKAVTDLIYYPEYVDGAAIYDDLYTEITQALAELDPAGDFVSADIFYGSNAENSTSTPADQVVKWKKLGNSLLLRLGMRYSKVNPSIAASIVAEAFAGGVMTSNADNAYIKYDGSRYVLTENNNLRNFSAQNYAAEPFVEQLKSTNDPRGKYILAAYADPGAVATSPADTILANQFGVPIGVIDTEITAEGSPYRGKRGTGLNYSQMNGSAIASPAAPEFYVTYAQTSLLLAEARQRDWITTGSAEAYYEDAIRADMENYDLYPGTIAITPSEMDTYLSDPLVDFSLAATDEEIFELINTQYWIVNIRNGTEAFANFRRSGYPALEPNLYNNDLNGGFVRRLSYPDREASVNTENYLAASDAMGGDNLVSRVFWDVP